MRIKLIADTLEELIDAVQYIQKTVVVEDENGKNMLFKPFNVKCLLD